MGWAVILNRSPPKTICESGMTATFATTLSVITAAAISGGVGMAVGVVASSWQPIRYTSGRKPAAIHPGKRLIMNRLF